jgi:ketosteroid isomerase-like protein
MSDPSSPDQVSALLASLLRSGDVEAVMALYEDDAVFADLAGAVRGTVGIRAAHQSFVDSGNTLSLNHSVVFEVDDIALVHWAWTVTRIDGSSMDGVSAEVLRRRPNEDWKYVIDNSDGSALIEESAP